MVVGFYRCLLWMSLLFNLLGAINFKDTKVYRKAFGLSMEIFQLSKAFPKEERYSLTNQMRSSSRSVCSNLAEAYRKRRYPAHFISKLTGCDGENSEIGLWLHYAFACEYMSAEAHQKLIEMKKRSVGCCIT